MAEDDECIYLTKSDRKAKQKFTSYNFTDRNKKTYKMPSTSEDHFVDTEEVHVNARERDRESLNSMREELERARRDLEVMRTGNAEQQYQQRNAFHQALDNEQVRDRVNTEKIATIISNVQNFNLDIKMPKFRDEFTSNLMKFVEGLENFLK
ncbi:protein disaggregation chaperone [Lasius niger]|uniref:Protein disaggregation chaperone n=1 Tax=Lasius niger TaxID=67767 RepID=A0A0J7N3K4_LASNI|nr:protein disaggregation chaperone [Lasius niger]